MDLNSCCCCIYYHRNPTNSHYFNRIPTFLSNPPPPPPPHTHTKPLFWRQNHPIRVRALNDDGFVLEVMPHLIDSPLFYQQTFVGPEDVVAEQIAFHKDSPRGVHFRRACPREKGIIQYTGGLRGARASSLAYRWDPPNGLTIWRSIDVRESWPSGRLWGFLSEIYISVVAHGMMQVYHTGMPFLLFNLCFRYIFTRKLRNVVLKWQLLGSPR